MSGYKEFPADILEQFKDIIVENDFSIEKQSDYVVQLKAKTCILEFDVDRMDLRVQFANPKDDPGKYFHVIEVHKLLFPEKKPPLGSRESYKLDSRTSLRKQLKYYATLIQEDLSHVLQGDFTWVQEYRETNERNKKLIGYILSEMDYYHPISQKFTNNDPTWEADLIAYLEANNFTL